MPVPTRIKIEGLDKLLTKIDGERLVLRRLRAGIRKMGNSVRNLMRGNAPRGQRGGGKRGGKKRTPLYRSIKLTVTRDLEAKVKPTARHAHLVERGTSPHAIAPRRKRALAFGEFVRAAAQHPGSRAQPFVERTRQEAQPLVAADARELMREVEREWSSR